MPAKTYQHLPLSSASFWVTDPFTVPFRVIPTCLWTRGRNHDLLTTSSKSIIFWFCMFWIGECRLHVPQAFDSDDLRFWGPLCLNAPVTSVLCGLRVSGLLSSLSNICWSLEFASGPGAEAVFAAPCSLLSLDAHPCSICSPNSIFSSPSSLMQWHLAVDSQSINNTCFAHLLVGRSLCALCSTTQE